MQKKKKEKRKEVQREHRARSVSGLERNPSGTKERGVRGSGGGVDASEQSCKPAEGRKTEDGGSRSQSWEEELGALAAAMRAREEGDLWSCRETEEDRKSDAFRKGFFILKDRRDGGREGWR